MLSMFSAAQVRLSPRLTTGAAKIIPAVEPGDATAYANRIGIKDCILGGERGCMILPGFNVGNSPFEYNRETVGGKTVIISTSNGTPPFAEFATRGIFFSVHSATVLRLQERLPVSWTTF